MKKKILIANGVNLDLLGTREPEIYGVSTLSQINDWLTQEVEKIQKFFSQTLLLQFFQSNNEHEYLETLTTKFDAFILNPGAWTHTSIALRDRLVALQVPYVEVHLSQTHAREEFRRKSYIAEHSLGTILGFGKLSYSAAVFSLCHYWSEKK